MNKKIVGVIICLIIIVTNCVSVFAYIENDPELYQPGVGTWDESLRPTTKNKIGRIWATIITFVQLGAIACVVFAGLRYMFASADQKADIKQGMIYLVIGAVLVFGTVSIIRLVAFTTADITTPVLLHPENRVN